MDKAVTIYEAKTNLSKLVKKAQAGETIYIGAYGQPQVVLAPLPAQPKINIGVWAHKKIAKEVMEADLVGSDPDIVREFEKSLNKDFPS